MPDKIKIKGVIDEDFVNYRVPSMTIMFPYCNFKCNKEAGKIVCHNYLLKDDNIITVSIDDLCKRYVENKITKSIVCQGLEPFDSFEELLSFIEELRFKYKCSDPIVIYTGYKKEEINIKIKTLSDKFENIIIKFGRYIPNENQHFDKILSVYLSSSNQYAEVIC